MKWVTETITLTELEEFKVSRWTAGRQLTFSLIPIWTGVKLRYGVRMMNFNECSCPTVWDKTKICGWAEKTTKSLQWEEYHSWRQFESPSGTLSSMLVDAMENQEVAPCFFPQRETDRAWWVSLPKQTPELPQNVRLEVITKTTELLMSAYLD